LHRPTPPSHGKEHSHAAEPAADGDYDDCDDVDMDGTEGDDGVVAQGVDWVGWMGTRLPSNHPPLTEVVDSNPNDFLVKAFAFCGFQTSE